MKNIAAFIFITLLIGCKKETNQNKLLLSKVVVGGKITESFTYNVNGQLIKENTFTMDCTNPTDELSYYYKNNKLDSLKTVTRSIYSSTSAICNPLTGLHSFSAFEYDNQGKINKITKDKSFITFVYNSRGLIEKQILNGSGTTPYMYTYTYDNRGNIIGVTDGQGNTTQYEFDTKTNPYYLVKSRSDIITAFLSSPNNVVRISYPGGSNMIRYEYNVSGLPRKMFDTNGLTYEYVYE